LLLLALSSIGLKWVKRVLANFKWRTLSRPNVADLFPIITDRVACNFGKIITKCKEHAITTAKMDGTCIIIVFCFYLKLSIVDNKLLIISQLLVNQNFEHTDLALL
jgi:hypothetical protein